MREALKLLLNEMEYVLRCIDEDIVPFDDDDFHEALRLGKEALAQPEQEPVAWMYTSQWKGEERFITRYQSELMTYKADKVWPLYTTPPRREWVGLTDAEAQLIYDMGRTPSGMMEMVESKLKEKNT